MFRADSLMRRVLPLVAALTAIMEGLVACAPAGVAPSGSGGSSDVRNFILEDAEFLFITDVEGILDSRELPGAMLEEDEDTGDAQDRFLADWEKEDEDVDLDDVSVMTFVGVPGEHAYSGYGILQGEFVPVDIVDAAEEDGWEEDTYRDFPVWRDESGDSALAVFEEDGYLVSGDDNPVKDFLKALDRGEGFATDEHGLRRVLDAAGDGLLRSAHGNCEGVAPVFSAFRYDRMLDRLSGWAAETSGCEAIALAVTGGDEDSTSLTMAVLFRSERRAESGLEDLEERMEDSDELDIDVEDARVSGELAVIELVIHE